MQPDLPDLSLTTAVVLDVDGTIAGRDHRVSPRTRDLRVRSMDAADAAAMAQIHRETGRAFTWWTARTVFATHDSLRDALLAFGAPTVHLARPPAELPDDLVKTMIHGTAAEMDAVEPWIRRLVRARRGSMDAMWELSSPDANKWSGIAFVLDLLDLDPATTVGLGDAENDVVWMTRIGTPVAMGNARPEARAVARAVTGHHGDEGAADFLEEVLRQVRQRAA